MEGKRGALLKRKEPDITQDLSRPNATAIGMTWGFNAVGGLALVLYVVPALLFNSLPDPQPAVPYDRPSG